MTHTEEILVYRYTRSDDGFGEYLPATPTLLTAAPTWATIVQNSGDDLILSEAFRTANRYTITVNWKDGFTWQRNMFIVSARWGVVDIDGITETVRKRRIELSGVYITGVDETGSGEPSLIGGLRTLYYTVPADTPTISLPAIDEATIYLIFRDGTEKKVVSSGPQINEVAVTGTTLSLVAGDIFYAGERITILYR